MYRPLRHQRNRRLLQSLFHRKMDKAIPDMYISRRSILLRNSSMASLDLLPQVGLAMAMRIYLLSSHLTTTASRPYSNLLRCRFRPNR